VLTTGDPEQLCSAEDARLRASSLGWSDELVGRAAAAAVATPAPAHWRRLLVLAAGALGTGLFASGVVTFVAYNWAALGRFARLGLIQLLLIAATVLAARLRDRLAGQIALSLGAVLVGALLAVYGQTYQTGADPFELFLLWAALMVPWALAARFAPLFLLQSVVLGTGVVLAWQELAALGHQRLGPGDTRGGRLGNGGQPRAAGAPLAAPGLGRDGWRAAGAGDGLRDPPVQRPR
jgi:uncharacterized membrane protein